MASPITVEVIGDDLVIARLGAVYPNVYASILAAMTKLGLDLKAIVVDQNLSGAVLNRKTGTLAGAQNLTMTSDDTQIQAQVGFNSATVPYGKMHEFGVPKSWVIEAKRAKALRFEIGGTVFFRKSVVHPPLPERSFLRAALAQIAPQVLPELQAAVNSGIAP